MAPKKARKRTGAGSTPYEGIILRDARQKKRYDALKKRTITPTRYPPFNPTEDTTFGCLGIEENVTMLLENFGWMSFLDPAWDTYTEITLEFLSSLNFEEDKSITSTPNHKLSFRLFNSNFNLSLADFAQILGLSNEGSIHDSKNPAFKPEGFDVDVFWGLITGQDSYDPRTAKASRIHNPVFRYLHRIIAHTIFGRAETGTVKTAEVFMLWAMVHSHPVNTCYYLVSYLASLANSGKGVITVGGIVSFIVSKLGLDDNFDDMEGIGITRIDYEYCVTIQMIEQIDRASRIPSYLLISRQRAIELPNPEKTEITNRDNWLYPLAAGVAQFGDGEQVQEEEMAGPSAPSAPHAPQNPNFNMEAWCTRIEGELQRQGAELQIIREEQLLRGQRTEHMLQALMQHFNLHQAPPPGPQ